MTSLLKLVCLLWTLFAEIFAVPGPCGACHGSIAYEAPSEAIIDYDGASVPVFDYDSASTLCANESENGIRDEGSVFAQFAEFLAAKGTPKTRDALHIDLRNKGFEYKSTSPSGYVTYKGPDGRTVTIKPSGEVIPTQKVPKADGTGKFPQRQDYGGNPLPGQSHSTGHFVEPLADILPRP